MNELVEKLKEQGYEEVVVFSDPSYYTACIGVSTDNQAIYDYSKMVEYLVSNENMTEEEASDFISYNTIRSLPYAGKFHPIIMNVID